MSVRGRSFWLNESGATAALYALALPALVAIAGVGFDYARLASMDSELQNAADQAALAAVTQLNGQGGACLRAARFRLRSMNWLRRRVPPSVCSTPSASAARLKFEQQKDVWDCRNCWT